MDDKNMKIQQGR